jgi:hypothetical protein
LLSFVDPPGVLVYLFYTRHLLAWRIRSNSGLFCQYLLVA